MIIKEPHHLPQKHTNTEYWPTSSFFLGENHGAQDYYNATTCPNIPVVEKKDTAIIIEEGAQKSPQETWMPPVFRVHADETEFEHFVKKWSVKLFFLALLLVPIVIMFIVFYKLIVITINLSMK